MVNKNNYPQIDQENHQDSFVMLCYFYQEFLKKGDNMRHMLLVAHGSRRVESNDEVRRLTLKISEMTNGYDAVSCAFLELAEPLIPDGIRRAIESGASEVVVMPYFLSAGRHVVKDVPAEVKIVQDEYPEAKITIAPYLGGADEIADLIIRRSQVAGEP